MWNTNLWDQGVTKWLYNFWKTDSRLTAWRIASQVFEINHCPRCFISYTLIYASNTRMQRKYDQSFISPLSRTDKKR